MKNGCNLYFNHCQFKYCFNLFLNQTNQKPYPIFAVIKFKQYVRPFVLNCQWSLLLLQNVINLLTTLCSAWWMLFCVWVMVQFIIHKWQLGLKLQSSVLFGSQCCWVVYEHHIAVSSSGHCYVEVTRPIYLTPVRTADHCKNQLVSSWLSPWLDNSMIYLSTAVHLKKVNA